MNVCVFYTNNTEGFDFEKVLYCLLVDYLKDGGHGWWL